MSTRASASVARASHQKPTKKFLTPLTPYPPRASANRTSIFPSASAAHANHETPLKISSQHHQLRSISNAAMNEHLTERFGRSRQPPTPLKISLPQHPPSSITTAGMNEHLSERFGRLRRPAKAPGNSVDVLVLPRPSTLGFASTSSEQRGAVQL